MKTKRRLKALSLFSGAGGMDVGVTQAGFHVLGCIEIDPFCCETLRGNIERQGKKTKVLEQDIREVDPHKVMSMLRLRPGQLDLLFGGPPCQAFSQIGKQEALKDERGQLLFQMTRFAEALQPKALLMEQVIGLRTARGHTGQRGEVLSMLLSEFDSIGYDTKFQVINAADYGVAQLRKRIFLVASKRLNGIQFPLPSHAPADERILGLPPHKTVREAFRGLRQPSGKKRPKENSHTDVTPAGDIRRITGVPEGSFLAAQTHLPKEQLGRLTKKDTTKFLRVSRKRPANTLRCGEIFFHATQDRYLTPREYMRLHGYPDEYLLKGPIRGRSGQVRHLDQHRQVANSVPPPIAKVLAETIRKEVIECRKSLSCSDTG